MLEHVCRNNSFFDPCKLIGMFLSFQTMDKAPFQDFSGTDGSISYGAYATIELFDVEV